MAPRIMRLTLGILVLIALFFDPISRWLLWFIAIFLIFQGITNIQIFELFFKNSISQKSFSQCRDMAHSTLSKEE